MPALRRGIGRFDATMLVVGSMIGSGIFLTPSESARLLGVPGLLLCAWGLAGLLTFAGATACAEMAAMMPQAGGPYVFLRAAFPPLVPFLYGWALLLIIQTGTIAAVATAFAKFAGVLFPAISSDVRVGAAGLSVSSVQLLAAALVVLLTAANATGLKTGTRVQNVMTVVKLGAFALLCGACLALGGGPEAALWAPWQRRWQGPQGALVSAPWGAPGAGTFALLGAAAMVGPLFSQSAWNNVTFAGSEVSEPERSLPRALIGGCLLTSALYMVAVIGYEHVLSFSAIADAREGRVAAAAAEAVLPGRGARFMAGVILLSTFGCANGLILSGARVVYAMAVSGSLPAALSAVNRAKVPARALWAQCAWTLVLVLSGSYSSLLRYVVSAELCCFAAIGLALFALRRSRPEAPRPYLALGYPLLPALYVLGLLALAALLLLASPRTSLPGYALVACGVPVYYLLHRNDPVSGAPGR